MPFSTISRHTHSDTSQPKPVRQVERPAITVTQADVNSLFTLIGLMVVAIRVWNKRKHETLAGNPRRNKRSN